MTQLSSIQVMRCLRDPGYNGCALLAKLRRSRLCHRMGAKNDNRSTTGSTAGGGASALDLYVDSGLCSLSAESVQGFLARLRSPRRSALAGRACTECLKS